MLTIGIAIIVLELSFNVSKVFIFFTIFLNVFQLGTYIAIVISDPGIPKQSINPNKDPSAK